MAVNYYKQTELVIKYIDNNGAICKTITNRKINKNWFHKKQCDTQDDISIDKLIKKYTRQTPLYENDRWTRLSYEQKYMSKISLLCPTIKKLLKVYKNHTII